MMRPNSRNFCGGAFLDWLEVNLTDKCNAHCDWCIEKHGYHPKEHTTWQLLSQQAIDHGASNIILLGGEPMMYEYLSLFIRRLRAYGKNVWMTTNGSMLFPTIVKEWLFGIKGVNISIHHYDLEKHQNITGTNLNLTILRHAISALHLQKTNIRLNCNCIKGYIDSEEEIYKYIKFAKRLGVDKVRFAELKQDEKNFVDLADILHYQYGLNDNPFTEGCNSDTIIEEMPINFRQMCGLQTTRRKKPLHPQGIMKKVLYYDGNFYNGWQTKEAVKMKDENNNLTNKELLKKIQDLEKKVKELEKYSHVNNGGFCQY